MLNCSLARGVVVCSALVARHASHAITCRVHESSLFRLQHKLSITRAINLTPAVKGVATEAGEPVLSREEAQRLLQAIQKQHPELLNAADSALVTATTATNARSNSGIVA